MEKALFSLDWQTQDKQTYSTDLMVLAATKKLVHIKFQFIDKTSFSSLKNQSSGFSVKPHSSLREEYF